MGAAEHFIKYPPSPLRRMQPILTTEFLSQYLDNIHGPLPAIEHNATAGGFIEARQAIEYRGFARAVRPDQRGDRTAFHFKINIVERFNAAELHHQMLDLENRIRHGATPLRTA